MLNTKIYVTKTVECFFVIKVIDFFVKEKENNSLGTGIDKLYEIIIILYSEKKRKI